MACRSNGGGGKGTPGATNIFFLIAAEAVAKIVFKSKGEGQSKRHVYRFFAEICSDGHRQTLGQAFSRIGSGFLSWREVVDGLYRIRCDVVHEGKYFYLQLLDEDSDKSVPELTPWGKGNVIVHISAAQFRSITLEGAVRAVNSLLTQQAKPRGVSEESQSSVGPGTQASTAESLKVFLV